MVKLKPCPFCGRELKNTKSTYLNRNGVEVSEDFYSHDVTSYPEWCPAEEIIVGNNSKDIKVWNQRAVFWVSVSEKLPEYGDTVLAYIKHNYSDTDGWRAYRVYKHTDHWVTMGNLCEVIAWMPLPDAPKEMV
ncbi:MAG: hypothetical protein BWY67_01475 [Bacteroidetes bacterium ADurb.Bin397]|nr:MAG: hypothetical protein BWY67_01475 [Bacteroidetes bacterium ADurb.Bin397]